MAEAEQELVFVALGGLGEIGRNCGLYGFGTRRARKWLMVDLGVSFAGPETPGVDLVLPDLAFVERIRRDLVGLVITHAHEDHIGALGDLWPRLKCPVYATRFAMHLFEAKRGGEPDSAQPTIHEVAAGARVAIGPFDVEFIDMAHSIPESMALAIRTPAGLALHTGDWKIDPTPVVGRPTDEARLRAIGAEGVDALVCDSTNILRDGESPSESEVAETLRRLILESRERVVVTTFASNVARIRAVVEAAQAAQREVVVLGRAMQRVIEAAQECGYLPHDANFLPGDAFERLPRGKVVALATGSQGEPRAAMARIADEDHPTAKLAPGDRVIFSSRTIPGNERPVARVVNGLIDQGVDVVTDRTHLVHVSGHPRRAEVAKLYGWLKPKSVLPAHGEALHLHEHAAFARLNGAPRVVEARDGDVVRLAPAEAGVVDRVDVGRLYKDGAVLVNAADEALAQRARLAFAGIISIGIGLSGRGDVVGAPDVLIAGLPARGHDGRAMDELVDKAIFDALDALPRPRRRDPDTVSTAVERAVRGAVNAAWGKRPVVHVLVVEV